MKNFASTLKKSFEGLIKNQESSSQTYFIPLKELCELQNACSSMKLNKKDMFKPRLNQ